MNKKLVLGYTGTVREFREYLLSWRTEARLQAVLNHSLQRRKLYKQRAILPRLKGYCPLYWE